MSFFNKIKAGISKTLEDNKLKERGRNLFHAGEQLPDDSPALVKEGYFRAKDQDLKQKADLKRTEQQIELQKKKQQLQKAKGKEGGLFGDLF